MAKGRAKDNSNDSSAPPQPRSLRSRKRNCPCEDISETSDVQATLLHQETEGNNEAVEDTVHQCPLQKSPMISIEQHQAAELSCPTTQDPATEEKLADATSVPIKPLEEQEEIVTNPNSDYPLEGFRVDPDNDPDRSGGKRQEITAEECDRSSSQTCTDQLQVFLPASEVGDGSGDTALGVQTGAQENLERNQETSQEEPSDVYTADAKETSKEAALGLPAKKKRRMGMCGLTEKERSHFLQIQKRENGQNGPERVKREICTNVADPVAQEEIMSSPPVPSSLPIPVSTVSEQNEAEIKSSHSGGDDRAETEVHITVSASDGTSTVCDPGSSKEKSCGAEEGSEQTADTKSDPPAEEEEEEEQMHQAQSAIIDQSPAITFHSNPTQNEETEHCDTIQVAPLQVNGATETRDEKKEELARDIDGAEAAASTTETTSGGFSCGSVEVCKAAETPSGSDSRRPDDEPGAGPSTVNAEDPQTRDTTDPFGSGYLDYVSDLQLNTIALIEEEVMKREDDCHEDATDLICGLIRELSSLNRKVMATHRELESLRRSGKTSRSSTR